MNQITENELIKIGFHRLGYPELHFLLNDETSLVMVYAECKWYASIHQFQGLKPPMERIYIPKDIKSINDVKLLIKELKELVELLELIDWLDLIRKNYPTGSYTPEQSHILSERLNQQNQPIKASDLSIFKNKSPK